MVVEESLVIHAGMDTVWETFTDLTCWRHWNTVLKDVSTEQTDRLAEGETLKCRIRPFFFPVYFEAEIEEVVQGERISWSGSKYGIYARHQFYFAEEEGGVRVRSRETFQLLNRAILVLIFPEQRIRELTIQFLTDLKTAAEIPQS